MHRKRVRVDLVVRWLARPRLVRDVHLEIFVQQHQRVPILISLLLQNVFKVTLRPKLTLFDLTALLTRFLGVKKKIVVLSGKGGVGKSTVTSLLARCFASDLDLEIGLLDIDITGPSQDLFMGVKEEEVHDSATGWTPVYADENLCIMSAGFILNDDAALIWSGSRKTGLLKKFLKEVEWGELDFLLIDSPPGTSDEHMGKVPSGL